MRIAEQLQTIAENQPKVYDAGANHFGLKMTEHGTGTITLTNVHTKKHDIKVKVIPENLVDLNSHSHSLGEGVSIIGDEIHVTGVGQYSTFQIYFGKQRDLQGKNITFSVTVDELNWAHGYGGDFVLYNSNALDFGRLYIGLNDIGQTKTITAMVPESDYLDEPLSLMFYMQDALLEGDSMIFKNICVEDSDHTVDLSTLTVSNGIDTFTFNENGTAKVRSISPETTLALSDDNIEFGAEYFVDTTNIIDSNKVLL